MAGREILRSQYLSASWGSYYIIYTTYDIYGYATFLNQFGIDIQTGYFFSQKRRFDPLLFVYGHDQLKWTYQRWVSINWNGQFCRQNAGENASKGCFSRLHFCTWTICRLFPSTDWTHFTMNKKIRTSCHMIARAYLRDKLRNGIPFLLYHFYPHLPFLFVYMHRLKN